MKSQLMMLLMRVGSGKRNSETSRSSFLTFYHKQYRSNYCWREIHMGMCRYLICLVWYVFPAGYGCRLLPFFSINEISVSHCRLPRQKQKRCLFKWWTLNQRKGGRNIRIMGSLMDSLIFLGNRHIGGELMFIIIYKRNRVLMLLFLG